MKKSIALIYVLLLLTTSFLGRGISNYLRSFDILFYFIIGVFLIILILGNFYLVSIKKMPQKNSFFLILKMTSLYLIVTGILSYVFIESTEELLHFIEYPLLFLLILGISKNNIYALLYSVLIAIGIESTQYFIPSRVFDLKDVALNCIGVFIGYLINYYYKNIAKIT